MLIIKSRLICYEGGGDKICDKRKIYLAEKVLIMKGDDAIFFEIVYLS